MFFAGRCFSVTNIKYCSIPDGCLPNFPILDDSEHSVLFENNKRYPLREVQIGPVVEQMILFHYPPEAGY